MSSTNDRNREPRNARRAASTGGPARAAAVPEESSTHAALMEALADSRRTSTLLAKVAFMARTRYGIQAQDAQDVFHEAVATYLRVHERYPPQDNHFGILVGIFQRKALEFLGSRQRTGRMSQRLAAKLRADRPKVARGEDPAGTVADRVIRGEDAAMIRRAIEALSPEARDLLLALAEGRASRLDMIAELGLNRNTFDTRLRTLRLRLKKALTTAGVL